MRLYEKYKPFRNYMRRFDIVSSLVDIWRYSLHVMEGDELPPGYAIGKNQQTTRPLREYLFPWDLDILAREIVLNAGRGGDRSLKNWNHLAIAVNHLRRLDEAAYGGRTEEQVDIMFQLHRIAHRQFPWQTNMGVNPMMRAFKIFGESAVEAIVERQLGMTTRQFLLLGMALGGHFIRTSSISANQEYGVLKISGEASRAFFSRITCSLEQLKADTAKRQSYDSDWTYVWNPLEATPLVSFDRASPDRLVCPIPRYLLRRASAGIFYDLVRAADFDNPFGNSFQAYIGEVTKTFCAPPQFVTLAEEPYYIGNNKMHGVDWIVSDKTAHLFIECKTKRLTVNAKTLGDAVALNKDLCVMATAIVQHYRNIQDALEKRTKWVPNGLSIYPLVLTLEDWFILSPRVNEMLKQHVLRLLAEICIPEQVLDEMPYTIASAHEFEIAVQIIARRGISPVMSKKTEPDQRLWSLLPFITSEFNDEMRYVNWRLFADDWRKLLPRKPDGRLGTIID